MNLQAILPSSPLSFSAKKSIQTQWDPNASRRDFFEQRDREFEAQFATKPLVTLPKTLFIAAVSITVGLIASVVNQPAGVGGGRLPNNLKLPLPLLNQGLVPVLIPAGPERNLPESSLSWSLDYEAPKKIKVRRKKRKKSLKK